MAYTTLVNSLKRLYEKETLDLETIKGRVVKETITEDEFEYVTGEEYSE